MDRRKLLKTMTFALGATIATPTLMQLFAACKAPIENTWTPLFLSIEKGAVLVKISQTIIPLEENSVLKEEIPTFIDLILNDVISPTDQIKFLDGAVAFEIAFNNKFNTSIHKGTPTEFKEILSHYFTVSKTEKNELLKTNDHSKQEQLIYNYLLFIRKYSIWGYATSKSFVTI